MAGLPEEVTSADLARAIALAAVAHSEQIDKSGHPYILHPIRVMQSVYEHGLLAQIVAVLHDVVEDTWVTLDLLRLMGYHESVIDGVDAISRREREEYFRYIGRCGAHPVGAIVKLADLRDNSDPIRAFSGSGGLLDRYAKARLIVEQAIASRTPDSAR